MAKRCITLGSGKRLTLGHYALVWRRVKEQEAVGVESIPCNLRCGFSHKTMTPTQEVLTQFRDGLHDRINRHDPRYGRGRKWSREWQTAALRVAWAIRDHLEKRVILHAVSWRWPPLELRRIIAPFLDHDN